MTTQSRTPDQPTDEFPTARLEPRRVIGNSKMWWATAAALVVAGLLVWRSTESVGPTITIRFPEGHGLTVGDFVRHRGIEVGHVDRIELASDLESIEVEVTLLAGAEGIAREGTRFWIVRPQISLVEVRGLDTAIGAKYIAVSPAAQDAQQQLEFEGLATPPAGDAYRSGMEVVLRGDSSYGLTADAPVSWRGVDVGQVLSVDLASDTRYVDVRVRIDSAYKNLVRANSKFWATSGLGIDAGFTGFSLKAESLTTIARGGVSFITPADDDQATAVQPGHVFTLHAEEDADWTEDASTVSLIDFPLPPTVILRATWKQKYLGFTRSYDQDSSAVVVATDKGQQLFTPDGAAYAPEDALDDTWHLDLFAPGSEGPLAELGGNFDIERRKGGVAVLTLEHRVPASHAIPADRVRTPPEPEDCCLVRSVAGDSGASSVIHSLSRALLTQSGDVWQVDPDGADLDDWHGAAVVATSDGALVGLFVVTSSGPTIAPLRVAR